MERGSQVVFSAEGGHGQQCKELWTCVCVCFGGGEGKSFVFLTSSLFLTLPRALILS